MHTSECVMSQTKTLLKMTIFSQVVIITMVWVIQEATDSAIPFEYMKQTYIESDQTSSSTSGTEVKIFPITHYLILSTEDDGIEPGTC